MDFSQIIIKFILLFLIRDINGSIYYSDCDVYLSTKKPSGHNPIQEGCE